MEKHIDAGNNKQINMFVNCTAITAVLYAISGVASGIYGGRLPIYTTLAGYVAVPWMIDHIFTESSARIVKWDLFWCIWSFSISRCIWYGGSFERKI